MILARKTAVVVPNWNGKKMLPACLDALEQQTVQADIILVDNGSVDGSAEFVEKNYPDVILLRNPKNLGFAGGVNTGIRYALKNDYALVALLNNDAVASEDWLKYLAEFLEKNKPAGIVTSKILEAGGKQLDSTGDIYTIWGLPFPRGRDKIDSGQYDSDVWVFGASGGASLYRADVFRQIGLFDEDFFAYYEDIDLSFRAQLYGWKIGYEPRARVLHQIGATSGSIKGLAAYNTLKNLPLLLWKDVPWPLMPKVWPRLVLVYLFIAGRTLLRGQFGPFFKGTFMGTALWPKKLLERRKIQKSRKVSVDYINTIITHDLPPNAHNLRRLRDLFGSSQ